jgi:hypothetical protein
MIPPVTTAEAANPERCVEAYYLRRTRFERTRRGTVWRRCGSRYPLPEAGSQVFKDPRRGERKTTNFNDARADEVIE